MKCKTPWIVLLVFLLLCPSLFMNCSKKKVIERKQIVLISLDTLRADHLTAYGYSRDTSPNLSELIKDSLYYTDAYPNGCWTMPSHMSLLTGTLPSRHGISKYWKSMQNNKYPKLNASVLSITEILKAQQVKTLKFARLPDELGFGRGFDTNNGIDPFANEKKFEKLLKTIDKNKGKDFFLFIHTWMIHAPYGKNYFLEKGKLDDEKRNFLDNFRKIATSQKKNLSAAFSDFLKDNLLFNVNDCVALYDSGIRYVDSYIGKLVSHFKQMGIYDDLLIIVLSDHGEHFAEHDPGKFYDYHGKDHYEEFLKVPLIIKYPHGYKRGRMNQAVSLIDIVPTILDFYDMEMPSFVQGESLLKPYPTRKRKYIVSEAVSIGDIEKKMIRVGDLKYIVTMENSLNSQRSNWDSVFERRLFDLKNDPLEKNNLYNDLKFRRICIDFEKMLANIIKNSSKTNQTSEETEIEQKTLDHMKSLGYL